MQRETDALTPLDARNSLLIDRKQTNGSTTFSMSDHVQEVKQPLARNTSPDRYLAAEPANPYSNAGFNTFRPLTPSTPLNGRDEERLIGGAAPMGREPTLPNMGGGGGYGNNGYAPYRY